MKQAPKSWNDEINTALIKMNFIRNRGDPCLYRKKFENDDECILLIYVDDIQIMSKKAEIIDKVIHQIESLFEIRDLGEIQYYLGIQINKTNGVYNLNQQKYINKILNQYSMHDASISKVPITTSYGKSDEEVLLPSNTSYQQLIGSLLYITINTRPDISAAISILAQKVSKPSRKDWNELKRVLKYLKGTADLKLFLGNEKSPQELYGYADANYGEDRVDRKSNSGYIFMLNGGTISWKCKKQTCVSLSSTEAEFVALCETAKEALWIRYVLSDLNRLFEKPTTIFEDNQSYIKMFENQKVSNRTKHIDIKYHFLKEIINNQKDIILNYCSSKDMIADMMTKSLPIVTFIKHRNNIQLQN